MSPKVTRPRSLAARGTAAMRAGLLCYAMGGTVDGRRGDHVLLAPPYTLDASHEDEIVAKLADALGDSVADAPAP